MQAPSPLTDIVHFGIFQLDLKARELHKAGEKVKLQLGGTPPVAMIRSKTPKHAWHRIRYLAPKGKNVVPESGRS